MKMLFGGDFQSQVYKKGGMLNPHERYVLELEGLTGVRKEAVESFITENKLSDNDVLNIVIGLGRKQLKGSDFSSAVVGVKDNNYSKKIISFAKDNKGMKLEFGGDFQAGVYAKGGSLEAHGIKEGDTFIKTISGVIQKVRDKNGKIVYIDLSNGERDSQPPLPFENGGGVEDNEVQYITYKDEEIMYEPNYSEYFVNDEQFNSLQEAKNYIDNGSLMSNKTINAYRKGAFENGGGIGMEEDIDMSDDNRLRVRKPAMPNRNVSKMELAEKYNSSAYEFMTDDKKAFGGSLFNRAKKMATPIKYPNLEDKNVTLKNGKLVKVFSQSGSTLSVIEFGKIGSGVQPTKIDISEIEPSSYKMGGALVGNQKRIDMNKNGKIDAEDFKLLRSSMNGAWRNDHKHVNHNEDYEVRYARPRPNRKGYKGVRKFEVGGGISNFERLSRVVAKNYEGKRVKPQYQKDYGKVYNKSEANEVGNRVAGKIKMMKK